MLSAKKNTTTVQITVFLGARRLASRSSRSSRPIPTIPHSIKSVAIPLYGFKAAEEMV